MTATFGELVVEALFACVDRQKLSGHPNALSRSVLKPLLVEEVNRIQAANGAASQGGGKALPWPERIYAAYPRHVGRRKALAAIETALKAICKERGEDAGKSTAAEWLFERTQAFADAVKKWPPSERQFIPHPSTWFNQGRYADDPKEWERGQPSAATPTTYERF